MPLTDEDYDTYSPLSAYLDGKDDEQRDKTFFRFGNLPEEERQILAGTKTAETIADLVSTGTLPQNYGKAVAKIIYLVTSGEVPITGVDALLERLGLSVAQAQEVSSAINMLVAPVIKERATATASMPELPPLTQKMPPIVPAPDSSKTTGRNIIDLRKQQTGQ